MRRALALTHLDDSGHGPHVNDRVSLRCTVDSDPNEEHRLPMVVVDGREISWDEFGRMVSAFEGWQFKLEFRDLSEEVLPASVQAPRRMWRRNEVEAHQSARKLRSAKKLRTSKCLSCNLFLGRSAPICAKSTTTPEPRSLRPLQGAFTRADPLARLQEERLGLGRAEKRLHRAGRCRRPGRRQATIARVAPSLSSWSSPPRSSCTRWSGVSPVRSRCPDQTHTAVQPRLLPIVTPSSRFLLGEQVALDEGQVPVGVEQIRLVRSRANQHRECWRVGTLKIEGHKTHAGNFAKSINAIHLVRVGLAGNHQVGTMAEQAVGTGLPVSRDQLKRVDFYLCRHDFCRPFDDVASA